MKKRILIIEDEVSIRRILRKLLELRNFTVDEAENGDIALRKIRRQRFDLFLLDMRLPDMNGIDILKQNQPIMEGKTIVVTAHATVTSAVEAIKHGAFYYLEKPLDEELLFIQINKIFEISQLKKKNISLKKELISEHSPEEIVAKSQKMVEVFSLARRFAKMDDSIVVQGETGVGKEVVANYIHRYSKRKKNIFLPINCSSIPEPLFESELFGFKKGAFTGAAENYKGRFIQANKGTIFLDEIGEMPQALQSKLLRVLDDNVIFQLGSSEPIQVDVRIIAATNKDLWQEVEAERFRKDLFYRLRGTMIIIPPLRDRKEDIPELIKHFISHFNDLYDKNITEMTRDAEAFLVNYPWDGNIRELKNAMKSIFSLKDGNVINLNDVRRILKHMETVESHEFLTLRENEIGYVKKVLDSHDGNIARSAKVLGISRSRLYRKLEFVNLNGYEKN